ncbi:MAG: hypothetical protein ABIP95_07615 [Pelobium sp.]
MSTAELRNQIIHKLNTIEDEAMLSDIYKLIEMESEIETVYQLSIEEKEAVEMAFQDIDEGKAYSSLAADALLKKWLKK